jgi:sugar O-acyltransferase (sialic acid O-acetyltransferase NeuD family)
MKLAIYGYGGHAKDVASLLKEEVTFFVDDEYSDDNAKPLSLFDPEEYKIMIAIGNSEKRKDIVNKLPQNTQFFTFIHPTVVFYDKDSVSIGEGSFIGAYCILTRNISIGKHSILNRGNEIGHDCVIGNYFSAMPGSIISGTCSIGDSVYIGSNSSSREKIKICDNVTIGLNSGVVKDIVESGVYVGLPCKKVK